MQQKYTENDYWYGMALSLYCPSMILWLCLVLPRQRRLKANLSWSFGLWALYLVFGFIPSISIVFGVAGYLQTLNTTVNDTLCEALIRASNETNLTLCDGLLKASYDLCGLLRAPVLIVNNDFKTLGPTLLKGTLCVTPLLLLLFLNTASDANKNDKNKGRCLQVVCAVGGGSLRCSRNDRHRSGRERTQLWNLSRIWHSNAYCCLPKFFAVALANDRN